MGIPRKYYKGSDIAATYDYIDLATGTGYKNYYPAGGKDSTGNIYFLTSALLDSDLANFGANFTSGTTTLNFDMTFGAPAIINNADALVNFRTQMSGTSSGYVVFTIYHVRGSTVTSIGSTQSPTYSTSGATEYARRLLKISLTKKYFQAGDILRFTMAITRLTGGIDLEWDPAGRQVLTETGGTSASITSNITVTLPFKIDI